MDVEKKIAEITEQLNSAITQFNTLQRSIAQMEGALIILNQLKEESDDKAE